MKEEVNKLITEVEEGQHHNVFGWTALGLLFLGVIPRAIALVLEFICTYLAMGVIDFEEWFQKKMENRK